MSPEQAQMSDWDVDTRTDIYSLGILLYELLTGTTPFGEEHLREAGYLQMQKIICEEEPTKPSTKLSTLGEALTDIAKWHNCSPDLMPKLIRGDLDWIVMKTLEKDRTRRYDTASTLGMDVQRHLNSEPVQAAAPSVSYRLRKLLRRHRIAAAAGLAIVTVLLMAAVISAMYAVKAEEANKETTALLAGSYVNDAQSLCEQGHVGRGMLWLAHSLKIAPVDSDDLDRAIRASLAAWSQQIHKLTTVVQFPTSITTVAFTRDGSRILTALENGNVEFCDAVTGEQLGTPLHHGTAIRHSAISPDGNRVATSSWDGSVRLWDARTGDPVGNVMPPLTGGHLAFSADSARLMTGGINGVRLWDADTGESAGKGFEHKNNGVQAIACCPDGARVVLRVAPNKYQAFNVERREPLGPVVDYGRPASGLTISPDGERFATAGGDWIHVWDVDTGELAFDRMQHGGTFRALAFSPDGSRLVRSAPLLSARTASVSSQAIERESSECGRSAPTSMRAGPWSTNMKIRSLELPLSKISCECSQKAAIGYRSERRSLANLSVNLSHIQVRLGSGRSIRLARVS
jgi:hypothetical protein